jgi:hypothetical protein
MYFQMFLSFRFIAVAVVNPPDRKLVMYISVNCRKGVKQAPSKYFTLAMKVGKKNQFELEKISSWFQTGGKNPVHQTRYFKLEKWKNPVQIDRGGSLFTQRF